MTDQQVASPSFRRLFCAGQVANLVAGLVTGVPTSVVFGPGLGLSGAASASIIAVLFALTGLRVPVQMLTTAGLGIGFGAAAPLGISAGLGMLVGALLGLGAGLGAQAGLRILAGGKSQRVRGEAGPRSTLASVLVDLASLIAGPRRVADRDTWQGDLAGTPEKGRPLTPRVQRRYAIGLVLAALRMRLNDLTKLLWRPVDWLLQTDGRVFGVTLVIGAFMVRDFSSSGGISNVFSNWDNLFALGGSTWAATVTLRKFRGITPKPPKPRRRREDAGER